MTPPRGGGRGRPKARGWAKALRIAPASVSRSSPTARPNRPPKWGGRCVPAGRRPEPDSCSACHRPRQPRPPGHGRRSGTSRTLVGHLADGSRAPRGRWSCTSGMVVQHLGLVGRAPRGSRSRTSDYLVGHFACRCAEGVRPTSRASFAVVGRLGSVGRAPRVWVHSSWIDYTDTRHATPVHRATDVAAPLLRVFARPIRAAVPTRSVTPTSQRVPLRTRPKGRSP